MAGVHSALVRARTEQRLSKMSQAPAAIEFSTYSTKHTRPQRVPAALENSQTINKHWSWDYTDLKVCRISHKAVVPALKIKNELNKL